MSSASSLNVVALISGGKDSLFSILHCLAQGHKLTALANLYPQAPAQSKAVDDDDINSYMYQTVGHSVIPLYELALGIPLYRQPIAGSAVDTNKDYSAPPISKLASSGSEADEDETESLVPLLRRIMAEHPEVNAISTGAILSTYQRTRVESVAVRLGLTPLSYLWQYPSLPPYVQSQLLEDMKAVGQDARIIKVASGGLDEGFLWENVADEKVVKRLERAVARFGSAGDGAVLGEGGEFETLALDGPAPLWKCRIDVAVERVIKGEGGNATVKLGEGRVVEKESSEEQNGLENLRIPKLLDDEFEALLQDLMKEAVTPDEHSESNLPLVESEMPDFQSQRWDSLQIGTTMSFSNMIAPGNTAEEQMTGIIHRLETELKRDWDTDPSSIVFSTLLLRSMSDFAKINTIYGSLFREPNPPARVTVACGDEMPEDVHVTLSVVLNLREERRTGLHVQSRSYWAPANIGPYSQAISLPLPRRAYGTGNNSWEEPDGGQLVYIAGQIPLVPASMELLGPADVESFLKDPFGVDGAFKLQAVLALQHLWRIGRAVNVEGWTGAVAFLPGTSAGESRRRAGIALRAWKSTHVSAYGREQASDSEDEGIDVWDMKHGISGNSIVNGAVSDMRPRLPRFENIDIQDGEPTHPPCIVVEVDALPRGANIEWMSTGLADCRLRMYTKEFEGWPVRIVRAVDARQGVAYIELSSDRPASRLARVLHLMFKSLQEGGEVYTAHITLFVTRRYPITLPFDTALSVVPCKRVWGESGREISAALVATLTCVDSDPD